MNEATAQQARLVAERLAVEWGLMLGHELPGSSCSIVLEAGNEQVLKVPFPHAEEAKAWETVRAFSDHGGVPLLRCDSSSGGLLMPRLRPGTTLDRSGLDETAQLDVCAELILNLRKARAVDGIPLAVWFRGLEKMADEPLADRAKAVYAELASGQARTTLLHGDLHHFNILRHGDSWVVIDPKGLLGDPSFEVAAFMRNNTGPTPTPEFMGARLAGFAERLGDPIERLWGWSFVQTVACTVSPGPFREACGLTAQALWDARP